MSWFRREPGIDQDARREAVAGVNSRDSRITRRLGTRPTFDPVNNHEHGQMAQALQRGAEVAELTDDLRRAEDEASRHSPPFGLTLLILFCLAVEALGGVLIMQALGVNEGERLPLGVALALALIGITAVTSNRTVEMGAPEATPTRKSATVFVLGVYSLLVVALAFVRLRMSNEDGGGLEALPETIVMIATSVGPAWLAEHFLRKRRPAAVAYGEVARIRERLRNSQRQLIAAQAFVVRIARRQEAHDDQVARMRATFDSEYDLTRAERRPAEGGTNNGNERS